jgi:hypothetical protein
VLTPDKATVDIVLEPGTSVKAVYDELAENGADTWGSRKLELNIKSESNAVLDDIWSDSLFAVAEAMETKTYSNIPSAMKAAADGHQDVTVTSEMDASHVYVTLKQGAAVKYVVLPRTASTLEVW